MELERHVAMTGAAEDRAFPDEVAGILRCELHLTRLASLHAELYVEFVDADAMARVSTLEHQQHRLALLHRDLGWVERKLLGGDLHAMGCILCTRRRRR